MEKSRSKNIRESQIEESFVANLTYLAKTLRLSSDINLIARQLKIKGGDRRLDLLISHGKELCLIELKVVKYSDEFVEQTIEYAEEIEQLQQNEELVSGKLNRYLLVTEASKENIRFANEKKVAVIVYSPTDVLKNYFDNLSSVAPFLNIKPNDYGVYNVGLINRTLLELSKGKIRPDDLRAVTKLSKFSTHNHLRLGKEFGLVRQKSLNYFLTDFGDKYIEECKDGVLNSELTEKQISLLTDFISGDPFYSPSVFGIYAIVESAFILSRSKYPVELNDLRKMFQTYSGKTTEWQAVKSVSTATYTFMNFAIDLGLLGKIGKQVVITPAGFRFILMLQLHKSIEMIESLNQKF